MVGVDTYSSAWTLMDLPQLHSDAPHHPHTRTHNVETLSELVAALPIQILTSIVRSRLTVPIQNGAGGGGGGGESAGGERERDQDTARTNADPRACVWFPTQRAGEELMDFQQTRTHYTYTKSDSRRENCDEHSARLQYQEMVAIFQIAGRNSHLPQFAIDMCVVPDV
jgi:hypothetical protein